MSKILVTGGAGFIGSHLIEELSKNTNFELFVFDDLSIGNHNMKLLNELNVNFIKGSIESKNDLEELPKKVDYIFHLAAMNRALRSIKNPVKSNNVNITGTVNLLEHARQNDSKFVFASSSSVFGNLDISPRPEFTNEFSPVHPYGLGKIASEYYCRLYKELYDLEAITIRYFAVYGPRQSPKLTYSAVIPKFINCLLNKKPITIFGGEQTRNFTFVKDTSKATILAGLAEKNKHLVYQIAGMEEISITKLVEVLEDISNIRVKHNYEDYRIGDIKKSIPVMKNLIDEFNFKHSYSFHDGLKLTLEWFTNNPNYFD